MGLRGWGFGLWLLVWQAPSLRGLDPQRGELPCSLGSKRTDGSKGSEMATFRFIHAESGWPLHIDGLGDKLASLRYGDCRDDFSAFWIEPAGEGRVYLRNLATELPLHINGLGDQLASVRCGDCMDDYSQFYLCTAPFPSQSTPDGLLLLSVAMGRALRIGADRMASTMEEGTDQAGRRERGRRADRWGTP